MQKLILTLIIYLLFCPSLILNAQQQKGVELKRVVIDAGHGGHDPGAISIDGKLKEKNVVLDVALKLGSKIKSAYPNVEVIYTRDKDIYVTLDQRSNIANRNHADLFISIHCNSVPAKVKAPSGCETFIMGMHKSASNMEVCKIENSVVLLEDDYTTKYQGFDPNDPESYIFFNLMQNAHFEQSLIMADLCQKELVKSPIPRNRGIKQGGLLVLWKTTMPSILVELGFITNSSDRSALASIEKRDALASALFRAFKNFKRQYESEITIDLNNIVIDQESEDYFGEEDVVIEDGYYAIQVAALAKGSKVNTTKYKAYDNPQKFTVGAYDKYTIGRYKTREIAQKDATILKKQFKGAFVVYVKNNQITK